ncbi:hypothetical protein CLV92_101289 [Kineococcus xinjiangensis]|uniref:Uncharacterized protein n=1 Tax=Kineococcus xinjiangensis TaxID=512762 RepID=A0A2S6IWI0_9ACTN|nr:hypothetical protein [Kineococcus xinjiangensis]PPK98590.1 hypothetical protein CLV92_101289 [Kineococcus xinjiangensis]
MIDFEQQLRQRMHDDTREVQAAAWLPEAALTGAVRARRRHRLAWSAAATSTAVATTALILALPGTDDSTRQLMPAVPSTTTATTSPEDFTAGEFTLPLPVPLPDDAPDRPGIDSHDWRGQIRESMRRYPDAFVVPEQLPPHIGTMQANVSNGHPLITIDSEGPGVTICVGDLATCRHSVGTDWEIMTSAEVDSRTFHVFLSPPGKPTDTGLTLQQQEYWSTVSFTSGTPEWMAPHEPNAP